MRASGGYIEKIGRGISKIKETCKAAGLKIPIWSTTEKNVKLSFLLNVNLGGVSEKNIENANVKNEGAVEGAIEGATATVKGKIATLIKSIISNEGKRTPEYAELTKISTKSIERYMKLLRDAELIEFRGDATQTGGFFSETVADGFEPLRD